MAEIRLILKRVMSLPDGTTDGVDYQTVVVSVPLEVHDALARKDGYTYRTTTVAGAEVIEQPPQGGSSDE